MLIIRLIVLGFVAQLLFSPVMVRAEEVKSITLALTPRGIESPILKYRLAPEEHELKPGNAAPILLRLPWEQQMWMQKVAPTLHEWSEKPLDSPDWATAGALLPENFYREMKRAAFRRDAEWEYPIGEQPPFFILLPDVQGLRTFLAYGLTAKIRYHLSRGEVEPAREAILVGLANSRHLSKTPFYINQLVAAAIQRAMLAQAEELVAQPDCPNLYWALATLPSQHDNFRRAASFEMSLFASTFPAAVELDRDRESANWRKMAEQLMDLLTQTGQITKDSSQASSLIGAVTDRLIPPGPFSGTPLVKIARERLPALLKLSAERVAAMSNDEVGVRWYVHTIIDRDQRVSAALRLPAVEAWPQLEAIEQELAALQKVLPGKDSQIAATGVYASVLGVERRIQALRIAEAIRAHLASGNGTLPASLGEIARLPIPRDPLTSEPFIWTVENGVGVLTAPRLPVWVKAEIAQSQQLRYEIRVRDSK